jgi:hypothetical protein
VYTREGAGVTSMGWHNGRGLVYTREGAGVTGMWWCNREGAGVPGRELV